MFSFLSFNVPQILLAFFFLNDLFIFVIDISISGCSKMCPLQLSAVADQPKLFGHCALLPPNHGDKLSIHFEGPSNHTEWSEWGLGRQKALHRLKRGRRSLAWNIYVKCLLWSNGPSYHLNWQSSGAVLTSHFHFCRPRQTWKLLDAGPSLNNRETGTERRERERMKGALS